MISSIMLPAASFPINGKFLYEEAVKNTRVFSTGSSSLDELLDGGLWTGELLEIFGPPGCGKSQMCLTTAAKLLAESNDTVFYVDTSGSFLCERLLEIVAERKGQCTSQFLQNALSDVQYLRVFQAMGLLSQLKNLEHKLACQTESFYCRLRLIIVDSITTLISPILGGGQTQGHMIMMEVGRLLKRLSVEHHLAALVVNSVVTDWDASATGKQNNKLKPALGKSWKLVAHSRLLFQPTASLSGSAKKYQATVTKSNKMALNKSGIFTITERGVVSE